MDWKPLPVDEDGPLVDPSDPGELSEAEVIAWLEAPIPPPPVRQDDDGSDDQEP
jgi:hypothetical protein